MKRFKIILLFYGCLNFALIATPALAQQSFSNGRVATVGGNQQTYKPASQNTALVGDFNGDSFDDIAVHWDEGQHEGKWTISLNDRSG
ncbi:hypothetical protein QUF74_10835, partial [Candidatus Halobeggiatoa sp. HSG11]|nr:hypothetical protein [Candidatus Halobeggiatoa sp. HSG11]